MVAKITIPFIDKSFYKDSDIPLIKDKLTTIRQKYGTYINNISKTTNIPKELLISFLFVESGGNSKAKSPANAIGLMQLKTGSASDILIMENKKNRLNEDEKIILRKYIGDRLDCILKAKFLGDKVLHQGEYKTVFITEEDLYNPELSILIGAIYLGIVIDEHIEKGQIRLDKVISRYNRGYFAKKGLVGTISEVYENMPTETKNYITKLSGKKGILDIII